MLSFLSCKNSEPLETVESVDINKYLGQWYEIARLPNSFEKGMECVTANYTLKKNEKIEVLNKGYLIDNKGEFKTAKGVAWVPKTKYPGRLKVSFFRPFSGKYYIIALDKDYKYALVGDPSRKYLWILSRTKTLDDSIYTNLLDTAQKHKFDISTIIKVNQDCNY